ncbi:helix-turn-helix domain-containing protein [Phenylobacterium sp.]|uniref:helix-turn-helix domain-containing protein n=1 Tax=Phenylobacterium sp. TaxID=1871053 RepID=UPI002DE4B73E|nr:helix-turn-helix domain-containing protein [Phenylobacterium sp.]
MKTRPHVLDGYVIDSLMRDLVGHDRRPSAFLAYLTIAVAADGGRASLSLAQLAEQTGLSKRGVQIAVRHLAGRGLIRITKDGLTEAPRYEALRPWRREAGG